MDRQLYVSTVNTVQIAASLLHDLDLAGVLVAMEHADALGPIIDPTLYKNACDKMEQQRRLVQAAISLKNEFNSQMNATSRKPHVR